MKHIQILTERYESLKVCENEIKSATDALVSSYEKGGKLLLCGNGGSCADCDHIVGELMKGFLKKRPIGSDKKAEMNSRAELDGDLLDKLQGGLPAISLPSICALNSAFANDVDAELMYAQSLYALGREGDVLIAISTSGNAKNVCAAAKVAKAVGMTVIALTGEGRGALGTIADIVIAVPERETYKIQELHLPVYHAICAEVEEYFFET